MSFICPICGKDDVVERITSIRASGRMPGSFSGRKSALAYSRGGGIGVAGAFTNLSGQIQTDLGDKLAPPEAPALPSFFNGLVVLLAVFACPLGAIGLVMKRGTGSDRTIGYILLGIAITVLVTGLLRDQRRRAREDERYQEEKALWEEKFFTWDRLCYCFRDGVVFDPRTRNHALPDDMEELLEISL